MKLTNIYHTISIFTTMMLGTLSLLCDSRYLLWALTSALSIYAVDAQRPMWALASALSTVYVVNAQTPTQNLGEINRAIRVCEELLERAKSACARDNVELTERMRRLFEYVHIPTFKYAD
jgi:hypothetical protein